MKSSAMIYNCNVHKSIFKVGSQETGGFSKNSCYRNFNNFFFK